MYNPSRQFGERKQRAADAGWRPAAARTAPTSGRTDFFDLTTGPSGWDDGLGDDIGWGLPSANGRPETTRTAAAQSNGWSPPSRDLHEQTGTNRGRNFGHRADQRPATVPSNDFGDNPMRANGYGNSNRQAPTSSFAATANDRREVRSEMPSNSRQYNDAGSNNIPPNQGFTQFGERKPAARREKYMPMPKTEIELFDENEHIQKGKFFDDLYSEINDTDIVVTGGDNSIPMIRTFAECNFSEKIRNNLSLLKYTAPTQIQKCIIPLIQQKNNDIMGHAQTGSGKTAAFLLPIINDLQPIAQRRRPTDEGSCSPYAIIVAPTKELAQQLADDARSFSAGTGVSVGFSYGDMPVKRNLSEMSGCMIFIATCGRLRHFIMDGHVCLDNLRYLVLDEADRLIGDDNFSECIKLVKTHPKMNPHHRTLMFSATFDDNVQGLSLELLSDDYFFARVGQINSAVDTVNQKFVEVNKFNKQELLMEMLMNVSKIKIKPGGADFLETPKTIIFVEQKRQSDRVAIALSQNKFLAISINSDRTLKQRMEAARHFTRGVYHILVATDVAARGLNFPNVKHVINYDLPEREDTTYIHRIGRTGRAGNTGVSTSFFDPASEDRAKAKFYVKTLSDAGLEVPEFLKQIMQEQQESVSDVLHAQGTSDIFAASDDDAWA